MSPFCMLSGAACSCAPRAYNWNSISVTYAYSHSRGDSPMKALYNDGTVAELPEEEDEE